MSLKKILELADTHGFFSPVKILGQDFVNSFRLGPTGELLAQNIQKEWIYSCVSSGLPDTVFQHHSPSSHLSTAQRLKGAFSSARSLMNGKVPFALIEVRGVEEGHKETTDDVIPRTRHPLHYAAFVNQKSGQQFFYRWQQHRHMWWRKFSMDPGRFSLVENKDCNVSQVDIRVKFPWGDFTVETVRNHGLDFFGSVENGDKNGFEVSDNRKKGLPYVVESSCTLEAAMLCYLCDGFSTSGKSQFTLHRRLAPYKVAIAASAEPTTH
ncbi:hypothetical protein LSTR_LSTR009088 [Laodelphax striatellus]|uniref:Uncharacterized protein n=1 Tax=Laodelphax striatellus TaxID=195883 RepID=A0A482XNV4_LAOST|nr:hypothetical protein LSTR_LSTR009088 [Laodelphax striatellus]